MEEIILDIGGEGNYAQRQALSAKPNHPCWGNHVWFSLNVDGDKEPDIVGGAETLATIRAESVHGIYSSHTIEHLPPDVSLRMFEQWYRILKPGGRVEIRCPDIEWAWKEYFSGRLPEELLTELMLGIRTGPHELHRNMWWPTKLINELRQSGFVDARRIDYEFKEAYLDHWPYDGKHTQYHGYRIIDLLVEAYKAPIAGQIDLRKNLKLNAGNERRRLSTRRFSVLFHRFFGKFWRPLSVRRDKRLAKHLLNSILVESQPIRRE